MQKQVAKALPNFESVERVTSFTYFKHRSVLFWLSTVFVLSIGLSSGMWMLTTPHNTVIANTVPSPDRFDMTVFWVRFRGALSVGMSLGWVFSFALRLAFARHLVLFATALITTLFVRDLVLLSFEDDWLVKIETARFFYFRPFAIAALVTMSLSLTETRRFERSFVPDGEIVMETRTG